MGEGKVKRTSRADSQQPLSSLGRMDQPTFMGEAVLARCPPQILHRLRTLNEAEVITLFTPVVPHSPSTSLAYDMDPFEPLGRAVPRQVRHVPYRMELGMTELHPYFLPSSGVVMIIICATDNVLAHDSQAFERQVKFARDITRRIEKDPSMSTVPIVLLVISDTAKATAHTQAMRDFPTLITMDNYTTSELQSAVRVLFG